MSVSHLLGRKARTASGVEVSAPTVRSFFRALEVFGGEIAAVRSAARQIEGPLSVDLALAPFLVAPDDGRLEYVVEGLVPTFYTMKNLAPHVLNLESCGRALASMVAPLAPQIDELLGDPDADPGDDGDVSAETLLLLCAAERLHIDPMVILDWPLGLFLDTIKAFSRPPKTDDYHKKYMERLAELAPAPDRVPVTGGPTYPDSVA